MHITRQYEFDAGHRVSRHGGKCQHLHGHRYKLELSVRGEVKHDESEEDGMVADFSRLKQVCDDVCGALDHALILWVRDVSLLERLYGGLPIVALWKSVAPPEIAFNAPAFWEDLFDTKGATPLNEHGERLYLMSETPTAENMAELIRGMIQVELGDEYKVRVVLYETPNCSADTGW